LNRVAVVEIVPTGVVEQNAHHVPDLATGSRCPFQIFKPQLHLNGLDIREEAASPTRNNPLVKVALIGLLGRVRDSSVRTAKLSLVKVIS